MQPTIAEAIERFLADLRLSPRSRSTYGIALKKFLRHLADIQGIDPESPIDALREDHALAFLRDLGP